MHGAFHLIILLVKLCSGDEKARDEAHGCLAVILICGLYGGLGMAVNEACEWWSPRGAWTMVLAMLTPAALLLGGVAIVAAVRGGRARERFEASELSFAPASPAQESSEPWPPCQERPFAPLADTEARIEAAPPAAAATPPPTHDLPRLEHLMNIDFSTEKYFERPEPHLPE